MIRSLIASLALLADTALAATPPQPSADQLRQDSLQLDRIQNVFISTLQFGEKFWRESKRVADQTGPRIVHALMQRSKRWHEEEGLVVAPLVALLPRKPTLDLLHQYERSSQKSYQIWAHEFLIEMDSPDIKESVRRVSGHS